jgi:hypothetical protein
MARRLVFIAARSILTGWAMIFALTYVIEQPLLVWTARLIGGNWLATAKVSLDCLALAATGWVIGRLHRRAPLLGALAFALALLLYNFDPLLDVSLPWLIRLAAGALRDSQYVAPFATTACEHLLLFASLFVGAQLSRPAPAPLSLVGRELR